MLFLKALCIFHKIVNNMTEIGFKQETNNNKQDVIDKAQMKIHWSVIISECMYKEEIHIFQDSQNEPIISISFFPPTAQSSDVSGDMKWPHIPGLWIMWQQATNIQILCGSDYGIMYSSKEAIT